MLSQQALLFIPTFFLVSISPGMCMTLALSLGIQLGIKKTLWMMLGELTGVAVVTLAAVFGVASVALTLPKVFIIFKIAGACYLGYIGIQMWRAKGKWSFSIKHTNNSEKKHLISQGFVTAVANPKGWAFMIALLPPFIDDQLALAPQLFTLLLIILSIEFCSLMLYATGGKTLANLLSKNNNISLLNKISGGLMILVGVWLAIS
ncbi:threonine transporter RhtB [Saccharobesus litoralis]|uniref:Threonine transporter RhtB n=1 Tax=Saccharobesus litoralis TaxID=2172099 RepID=A0A2S0VUN7_9ALTE|nr:LysE family translocator [Saccharobesus litoralis]AWB67934.1 threonine transporter RhtB [Saccharobesus litoralis]